MRSIAGGLTHWDLYAGKLIFLTPVHVGSAQIGIATDSPLIMDATGLFYIPGSSIAGALRARALERFEDRALVELVFGWQKDDRNGAFPPDGGGRLPCGRFFCKRGQRRRGHRPPLRAPPTPTPSTTWKSRRSISS